MVTAHVEPLAMKLEVVVLGVSEVDRAKAFYEKLGWRLDADFATGADWRVVQADAAQLGRLDHLRRGNRVSQARLGRRPGPRGGRPRRRPRRLDRPRRQRERGLSLRRRRLSSRGERRIGGRDPQGRSYLSFASFEDPDGNGWLLQEVTTRAPGREWTLTRAPAVDVATLAQLLRETAEHHDHYEKTHAEHHWSDWYAAYLSARQNGSSPGEAAAAADRYMEEALHVLPR